MILRFLSLIILFAPYAIGQDTDSQHPQRIDSLASALFAEGNYWKLMEISKQIELDSVSSQFLFSLGMSYAALSEPQKAQELIKRAIALDSSKLQYRFQYARIASQSGQFAEAIEQLHKCIAMDSNYIPARFQMGLTYAAQKNQTEKELSIFASLIHRNPNDFLSLYYFSDAMKRAGMLDSAAIYLQLSLKVNPRYVPGLIAISNYLIGQKRYLDALPYYLKADSVRQGNKDLIFQIGECYRKLNNLPLAKQYFRQAIALDSTNALYHGQLAYAYYSGGEYDSSVSSYQSAILNDDENAQYYLNLALVYKKLDMTDMVMRTYRDAVRVRHAEQIAYIYNDLGAFCFEKKLWKEASDAFGRMIDIDPNSVDALYFMGTSLMHQSKNQLAMNAFNRYLKKTEDDTTKLDVRYSVKKTIEYLRDKKKVR